MNRGNAAPRKSTSSRRPATTQLATTWRSSFASGHATPPSPPNTARAAVAAPTRRPTPSTAAVIDHAQEPSRSPIRGSASTSPIVFATDTAPRAAFLRQSFILTHVGSPARVHTV